MSREASTTATFQQDALVAPINVAVPPDPMYPGTFFFNRTTGDLWLRTSANDTGIPGVWTLVNPGLPQSGTPVLYLVDNRYVAPPGANGPFPSIAAAKAQLLADGYGPGANGPATIMILRGTYVEDVSLDPGIRLSSMAQGPDGAVIVGTVTCPDPAGATTRGSISGVTIAPVAGDALVVSGAAAKTVTLLNVDLAPTGPGAAGLRVTNTNPASQVSAINTNVRGELGFQGDALGAGLVVWFAGGLNGSVVSVQNRGVGMICVNAICGSGLLELGAGFTQFTNLLAFQSRIHVTAGNDHDFEDVQCTGAGGLSPLTVDGGARVSLHGTFFARCNGNPVVIAGAGTVESVASLQFYDGDTIAPTISWNPNNTLGHAQPKAQLIFTLDPPANPYVVPARFETVIVRGALSARWRFVFAAANTVVESQELVFKNLDARTHEFALASGTVDNGLLALPANIATRDFIRARASRVFNDWVQC